MIDIIVYSIYDERVREFVFFFNFFKTFCCFKDLHINYNDLKTTNTKKYWNANRAETYGRPTRLNIVWCTGGKNAGDMSKSKRKKGFRWVYSVLLRLKKVGPTGGGGNKRKQVEWKW